MLNIAAGLKGRSASQEVVKMAKEYQCPACIKSGIPPARPFVGFEPPPAKWEVCESDFGEWKTGTDKTITANVEESSGCVTELEALYELDWCNLSCTPNVDYEMETVMDSK